MYKLTCSIFLLLSTLFLNAQYKNDNVLYKTVYPEDLVQQLKSHPGYILLDVRSKGESEDTSSMQSMNIGHLKNARNIDIRELGGRLNELQSFKNTPIFVYCSHSQRSRRASKMLADSGFTSVYNINGGMTTLLQNEYGINNIYETKHNYQLLSPPAFCREIKNKNTFIVDVRPDSSYNASTSSEMTNAMGRIRSAVHIPVSNIETSLSLIPKGKKIILVDEYSDESIKAANLLSNKGYQDVAVLFNGIYNIITTNTSDLSCKNEVWQPNKKYHILTGEEFNDFLHKTNDVMIIDTRTTAEFQNKSKDNWRNIGHIKSALNLPDSALQSRLQEIISYKNKPVIVYSFGSSPEAYRSASTLVANGFTNVNVLSGGIFSLRWKAANLKGRSALKDWVTDIPAENM
jgi:rhodanese-related sulfurtransferase